MSHLSEDIKEIIEEGILEKELVEESSHKSLEHVFLWIRNIAVFLAVIGFVISLIIHEHGHMLKSISYFLGAGAYISEILLLTDSFSKKISHHELFMAYCFGPLYILLGLSYLLEL